MEDLQSYIDNDQVVSVRWLANTMGSSVEKSRDLMADFKKKHAGTPASYLISGEKDGTSFGFRIVSEDKVEEEKKSFRKVSSVHIYSLQRGNVEIAKVAYAAHAVDQGQAEDCLWNQHPNSAAFVTNKVGSIRLSGKGVTIKEPGQRAIVNDKLKAVSTSSSSSSSSSSSNSSNSSSSSSNSSSSSSGNNGSKGSGSVISKSSTTSLGTFFNGTGKKTTAKPKAAGQSKLGFGQAAAAPKAKASSDSLPAAKVSSASPPAVKEKMVVGADDEEEEFDDGTGVKANKDNLKKRQVAVGMPVGEGGLHQADVEVAEEQQAAEGGHAEGKENAPVDLEQDNDDNTAKKGTKRKGKEALGPVHGAMDDYNEDQAELAAAKGGKRRKKKITEKLEMDDKGYMVKRMVEEWVTDDEADAPAPPVMAKSNPKVKAPSPKKKTPASKAGGKVAPGQKSLMGFFGKK